MTCKTQSNHLAVFRVPRKLGGLAALTICAALLAGCSSGPSRFDDPAASKKNEAAGKAEARQCADPDQTNGLKWCVATIDSFDQAFLEARGSDVKDFKYTARQRRLMQEILDACGVRSYWLEQSGASNGPDSPDWPTCDATYNDSNGVVVFPPPSGPGNQSADPQRSVSSQDVQGLLKDIIELWTEDE